MIIIAGLGNPGPKFTHTRHNAGFEALDFFAAQNNFPEFELSKKHEAEISQKDNVILVKPQTFMNDSGRAVASVMKNKEARLIVIHDEIDLPLGNIKVSRDSGPAGHKGVSSIINALGTKDFTRLKIGIATGEEKAEEVVLKKFSPQEQELLQQSIEKSIEMLKTIIDE